MEEVLAAIRKTFTEEKNSPDAEPETPLSDAGSGTGADPSS